MATYRFLIAYVLVSVGIGKSSCQSSSTAATPPANKGLPAVSQMKKTVVTVETDCSVTNPDGTLAVHPFLGTAFLVRFQEKFTYVVTNRHVVQPGIENQNPCHVTNYRIRLDRKDKVSEASYSEVLELGPGMPWTFSNDPSVDLAVSPFFLKWPLYDVLALPAEMLLGDKEVESNQIVEGDTVLFAGLFVQFTGQMHSEPIVRQGRIAMMPAEQTPTTLSKLGETYLVDAHVFGGNSGSPMFVQLSGQRFGAMMLGESYKLLGVVSGYIQETSELKLQPVAGYGGTVVANSGIAMVVPAQKVIDLLNGSKLSVERDLYLHSLRPLPR